jgi:hypothetical protein
VNLVTLSAIGAVACIAADLVHEGLGHGVASCLMGDRILSISTVALQNAEPNRIVAAAGTGANVVVGILSLLALRRVRQFTSVAYFLWLLAAFNLFNVGYLVFSAVSGGGDWGAVISGLSPAWLWRAVVGVAGAVLYFQVCRALAISIAAFADRGEVSLQRDGWRLVWAAYVAAGVVLTSAAALNPIGLNLILVSGVGASFGLNAGILFVPGMAPASTHGQAVASSRIRTSVTWITAAGIGSVLFIAVLGPGIKLAN